MTEPKQSPAKNSPSSTTTPKTFDRKFRDSAEAMSRQLIAETPELLGVIVIPVWEQRQPDVPAAVTTGRDGPMAANEHALFEAARQLINALQWHMRQLGNMLSAWDQWAQTLAEKINEQQSGNS